MTSHHPSGDKILDIRESPAGAAVMLARSGEPEAYVTIHPDELFVLSAGRPWRVERAAPTNVRLRRLDTRLQASARLGPLRVETEWRFDNGLLTIDVVWTNLTDDAVTDLAVGLMIDVPRATADRVTMPQVLYNNNPSADPNRVVPKLGPGDGTLVVEEHRLPIPGVNVEWVDRYLTLFAIPSYREDAEGRVTYGSLGAARRDGKLSLLGLSGVLSFNGEPDVRYIHKAKTAPYAGGYLTFGPGDRLCKTYILDWGVVERRGRGFRELVRAGHRLFTAEGARPLSLDEIVRYKTAALDDRWYDADGSAGYVKFNHTNPWGTVDKRPLGFLYGWTGQCLTLAHCDARLGIERSEPHRLERSRRAVDFYLKGSGTAVPGLRVSMYETGGRGWSPFDMGGRQVVSSRAHGETVCDLADVIALFRHHALAVPDHWAAALTAAADFLCRARLESGIYPLGWLTDGTAATDLVCAAGLPAVLALLKASTVLGAAAYREVAVETFARYHELHAETFERPFARATLDAACEDKESGMAYFQCAYELYRLTGAERYADYARLGADWLLTFVYCWAPVFDRGSPLRQRRFNTIGWPGVSVQNHHVDVFFPVYELWDFGRRIDEPEYVRRAEQMMYAWGQGIATEHDGWGFRVLGEQAEGFFPTDWQARGTSNRWNPSWVIAQVLLHALRMRAAAAGRE